MISAKNYTITPLLHHNKNYMLHEKNDSAFADFAVRRFVA